MATPTYSGPNQPTTATSGGGWLAQLGAYFSVPTPVYATAPVTPSPASAKAGDPDPSTTSTPGDSTPYPIAIVVPRPDACEGEAPYAIVIPRKPD